MENFKDFSNKKSRLTKRDYSADFRLADSDDFFGFDSKEEGFTLKQTVLGLVIGLPVLYAIVWVLLAMSPNI
jgi:hypothetical protein